MTSIHHYHLYARHTFGSTEQNLCLFLQTMDVEEEAVHQKEKKDIIALTGKITCIQRCFLPIASLVMGTAFTGGGIVTGMANAQCSTASLGPVIALSLFGGALLSLGGASCFFKDAICDGKVQALLRKRAKKKLKIDCARAQRLEYKIHKIGEEIARIRRETLQTQTLGQLQAAQAAFHYQLERYKGKIAQVTV